MRITDLRLGMKIRARVWPPEVYGVVVELSARTYGVATFDPESRDPERTGRYRLDVPFKPEDDRTRYHDQGAGAALRNFEPWPVVGGD
jgi:hypothetical protein